MRLMGITITRIIMIMDIPLATFTSIAITMIFIVAVGFIMITMREENTADRYITTIKHAERR
jgi:hypothetical protein